MTSRMQITMEPELQRHLKKRAAAQGVSAAEYMRRLVARDKGTAAPAADVSIIFDIDASEEPTSIARDKDKMIGEAVEAEHRRKIGRRA
jgi:hypothetical protein